MRARVLSVLLSGVLRTRQWCRHGLLALTLAALAACQTTSDGSAQGEQEVTKTPASELVPDPSLEPKQRLSRAIQLLENGTEDQARVELIAYLESSPRSALAKRLVQQIDRPISDYFPAENFPLVLAQGQSLSNVADEYLGDALLFHSLAKYNGIGNPSQVRAGQTIRVPATEAALAAQAGAEQTDDRDELVEATSAEDQAPEQNLPPEAPAEPVLTLAEIKLAQAEENYANGQHESALSELSAAAELEPDNQDIVLLIPQVEAAYIDELYRGAVSAFNRQDLDSTLKACDKILAIDPEHTNAQLYRTQALELQARLRKLDAG